jgi:DNA-directed RNA polymerase subunit N (RpoN/RPB10)
MYPYILCYCGKSLGHLFDLFNAMKRERYIEEFGEESFDPTMIAVITRLQVELGDILDSLHLHKDCCRVRMLTQVEFKEVY